MRTAVSRDGTPIAFDQSGQGPALILVGGAMSTRMAATPLAATLAAHFSVYAYDRRGRGDSGDTAPYAVEHEVEDLAALIKEAGGTAFVYGHSSGAVLALEAARLLPGNITRLAVYEPPFIIDDSRPAIPRDHILHLNKLISEDRRGEAVEYFMTKMVNIPPQIVAQTRQAPMWSGLEALAHTLIYDSTITQDTAQGDPSALKKWASVTVPTLVMAGGASPSYMHHGAQELVHILPNAQLSVLAGQDHGPADDVLVPALEAFFL